MIRLIAVGRGAAHAVVGLILMTTSLGGQSQGVLAVRGGEVHTLAGESVANGTVLIEDGQITAVGTNVQIPAGAHVIDASGKHVYPGMFDAYTTLGLTEIRAVDVTSDIRELGRYNPHLNAATAVHPASEHIPVARANGITHALSAPGGQGFAGQATVVHLDGWTVEEMMLRHSVGLVVAWPGLGGGGGRGGGRFSGSALPWDERLEQYEERLREMETWLNTARNYALAVEAGTARRDLRLEALIPAAGGELPVLISASAERDIRNAVEFGERNGLDVIITGGQRAWVVADLLAEKGVPVLLGPTQAMPPGADESYDEAYSKAGKLHAAGVKFAFATFNSSNSRTLPYEAGMAVGYGLPPEAALRAVTVNGAEILGLGDDLGTLEVGKLGNLIVTDGDPLEIQTRIEHLVINGREASTDNKHRSLYERYRARR